MGAPTDFERGRELANADRRAAAFAHANFGHDRRLRDEGMHDGQQRRARALAGAIPFDVRRRRETAEERRAAVRIVQRSLMSAVARSMFVSHRTTMVLTGKCSGRYDREPLQP